MEEKMNDTAQDGYLHMSGSAAQPKSQGSVKTKTTMAQTLSKDKYVRRSAGTGVDLQLDTKKEFDEEREKRIQLYTKRWENGFECISGKPMPGTLDKCTGLVIDRANQSYGSGEDDID